MQDETFIFDGRKHASLDGSVNYFIRKDWILGDIAEYLWEEPNVPLKWREVGEENFIAFIDENKAYIEGTLSNPFSVRFVSGRTSLVKKFVDEDIHGLGEKIGELLFKETFQ
ncbi:hypothetical protein ISTM_422 [Insectomime virus]|nr:hypothetical protein ISTM_422 [Insectomime virus]